MYILWDHHWLSAVTPSPALPDICEVTWKLAEGVNQFTAQPLEQPFVIGCFTVRLFHGTTILGVPLQEDVFSLGLGWDWGGPVYLVFGAIYWFRQPMVFRSLTSLLFHTHTHAHTHTDSTYIAILSNSSSHKKYIMRFFLILLHRKKLTWWSVNGEYGYAIVQFGNNVRRMFLYILFIPRSTYEVHVGIAAIMVRVVYYWSNLTHWPLGDLNENWDK